MPDKTGTRHCAPEELADYFTRELAPEAESRVEEHLAVCDECTALARKVYPLFFAWDAAGARAAAGAPAEPGRNILAAALAGSLPEGTDPAWSRRIQQWQERWSGKAEAALRVVFEASGTAARIISDGMESLVRPDGMRIFSGPEFATARGAVRTRGSVRTRGGQRKKKPAGLLAATAAAASGKSRVRTLVDEARRMIEVRLEQWPEEQESPLVLLLDQRRQHILLVKTAGRGSEPGCLIAEFKDLAPGDYIIAVEPRQ